MNDNAVMAYMPQSLEEMKGTKTVDEVLSYSLNTKELAINSSVVVLRHNYSRMQNESLEWVDIHEETVGEVYTVLEKTEEGNYLLSNGYYYDRQWLVPVAY